MRTVRTVKILTAAAIIVCGYATGSAQVLPQGVRPGSAPRSQDEAAYRQLQRQRNVDAANQGEMRRMERAAQRSYRLPQEKIGRLTAKERKQLEALRAPSQEDIAAYKDFLTQPNTGIVRLLPGSNCESKYTVRVDGACENMVPGSSYHRFRDDAIAGDLLFMDGALIAEGFFSNTILTGLGKIPLSDASLSSAGMKFLTSFEPSNEINKAKEQNKTLQGGIIEGNYAYSSRLKAIAGMTYGMRIVAYRNGNNVLKRINRDEVSSLLGGRDDRNMMFLALKKDKRVDLTLAFKISGSVRTAALHLFGRNWRGGIRRRSHFPTIWSWQTLSNKYEVGFTSDVCDRTCGYCQRAIYLSLSRAHHSTPGQDISDDLARSTAEEGERNAGACTSPGGRRAAKDRSGGVEDDDSRRA